MEEADATEPVSGFTVEEAMAKFTIAQAPEMTEQTTILESIQDGAYVESNRHFIRRELVETDALFDEVEAEMEAVAEAEQPKEAELRLSSMYLEPGTEITDISDEN